jgi:peroxiredoxin Q/BCP
MSKLFACLAVLAAVVTVNATELKVGDKAPNFKLRDANGGTYELMQYTAQSPVVVAWVPNTKSTETTKQFQSLGKVADDINQYNVEFFCIACEPENNAKTFTETMAFDFPVLTDANGEVAKKFGVSHGAGEAPAPYVYYIGNDGTILFIDKNVNVNTFGQDVINRIRELGFNTVE